MYSKHRRRSLGAWALIAFPLLAQAAPPVAVPRTSPQLQVDQCIQRQVKFVLSNRMADKVIVSRSGSSARVRWEVSADYAGITRTQLVKDQGTPFNLPGTLEPGKVVFEVISDGGTHEEGGFANLHVWANKGCGAKDLYFKYRVGLPKVPSAH
ncbi:MAG: hypothetical protein LJE84_06650 [Gammaproteobacteria bacterium]|jgi:hypothetical protein|nr:hypothetical protein [Gammaproteobacteria bacterium]